MGLHNDCVGRLTQKPEDAGARGGAGSVACMPVLDPDAIERLRQLDPGGSQGMLERVLRAYESSLTRQLAEIDAARNAQDRLLRAAHTLKSSSAAVGALDFSRLCAEVEHQLRQDRIMPTPAQLEALIHEGHRVLAAVGAMLSA
jgi:HPt (histidine-containing phosphotransfer) domain-containing protein